MLERPDGLGFDLVIVSAEGTGTNMWIAWRIRGDGFASRYDRTAAWSEIVPFLAYNHVDEWGGDRISLLPLYSTVFSIMHMEYAFIITDDSFTPVAWGLALWIAVKGCLALWLYVARTILLTSNRRSYILWWRCSGLFALFAHNFFVLIPASEDVTQHNCETPTPT